MASNLPGDLSRYLIVLFKKCGWDRTKTFGKMIDAQCKGMFIYFSCNWSKLIDWEGGFGRVQNENYGFQKLEKHAQTFSFEFINEP